MVATGQFHNRLVHPVLTKSFDGKTSDTKSKITKSHKLLTKKKKKCYPQFAQLYSKILLFFPEPLVQ